VTFASGQPANAQTFQYFSFTTLTPLGYGDFTAANDGGRAVTVIEALTGQIFLATLVARLVAAFRAPAERADPVIRRHWPPATVRRGGGISYRRKPAGNRGTSQADPDDPPRRSP
jgi:Ion channel